MGAATITRSATAGHSATEDRSTSAGLAFLAVGAVDAVLIGMFTLVWILEPDSAPSWSAVLATPFMAVLTLTLATVVRRRLPVVHRPADLLASTARWWSLFGLLLSLPALLIVASL